MSQKTIAIVCGGGPAPGINSVIRSVTSEANRNGWKVLGMYEGFSNLAKGEKKYIELGFDNTSRIHLTGGCILQMSRFNPTKNEADLKRVVDTLNELGVTHLLTIGGDDTAFSSASVAAYSKKNGHSINVVHVPKTIDNDLPLPEGIPTFGFETARAFGAAEVEALIEDARTCNNRWYITIAMGRTAGHLALGIGRSTGAAVTIIPEEFPQEKITLQHITDILVSAVVKRYMAGRNYGVAVVAEGVLEKIAEDDLAKLGNITLDEHGHIRYAELDFGKILKEALAKEASRLNIKLSIVDKDLGYEFRCTAPISYDIDYTTMLGCAAVQFLIKDGTGAMISIQDSRAVPMYFEDLKNPATGKTYVRKVNTGSIGYQIARGFMQRLEKEDLNNAEIAKIYQMSTEEFKKRYAYLFE